ncbi:MAG TPA: hypothetical protein VN843_14825 [Anaerolineales bacterium]|nr:hypothetical protein [Anaerolineales bacterium]
MKRIEQMSLWERAYVPEIVRGLSVIGYHFRRNLSIHILHAFALAKSSQADVTVQYPEERASYPDTLAPTEKCSTKDTELNLKSVRNEASSIVLPCAADLPSVALINLPESASDD